MTNGFNLWLVYIYILSFLYSGFTFKPKRFSQVISLSTLNYELLPFTLYSLYFLTTHLILILCCDINMDGME